MGGLSFITFWKGLQLMPHLLPRFPPLLVGTCAKYVDALPHLPPKFTPGQFIAINSRDNFVIRLFCYCLMVPVTC